MNNVIILLKHIKKHTIKSLFVRPAFIYRGGWPKWGLISKILRDSDQKRLKRYINTDTHRSKTRVQELDLKPKKSWK